MSMDVFVGELVFHYFQRSSADCSNIQSFGQLLVTPAMFQKHLVCTSLFVIIISLPQEEHANIYLSVDHIKLWPLNHCCLWFSVCGPEDISCQQSTRFKCVTSVITPVLITTTSVTVTPRLLQWDKLFKIIMISAAIVQDVWFSMRLSLFGMWVLPRETQMRTHTGQKVECRHSVWWRNF